MSAWENTDDLAAALPEPNDHSDPSGPTESQMINPQAAGWVRTTEFNYSVYNKTAKELHDQMVAQGGQSAEEVLGGVGRIEVGEWSGNAAVYEWNDEFGDVGPPFPELEEQLFGSEFHVKTGINFELLTKIDVVQEGTIQVKPIRKFADAGLHPVMLRNVELAGYVIPTPIQAYVIPTVLQGYDLVACAQTGSGKTAAFLIPILSKLMGKAKKLAAPRPNPAMFPEGAPPVRAEPLVLIVAPTRELATQIFDETRRFCYRTMFRPCVVYGGGPLAEQINQLAKGCDVLIGTPGRLCDFIDRPHLLTLKRLKYMVVDEADEMVSSDWDTELRKIMSGSDQEEGNITYLMFSATFPKMARDLARNHLTHDHVRLRVGRVGSTHKNIKQDILEVDPSNKRKCLTDLLLSMPPCRTIIFVNSKRTCDEIDDHLFNLAFPCTSIHGDRTQREREDSIRAFRTGKAPILIATGVSARGLDIHNVNHVINFDLPSSSYGGIQEYIHRIGRTGRIGNLGLATSFYTNRDEDLASMLVKLLLENEQNIPDFLSSYLPEGFTTEGGVASGDVGRIDWEDASDNGENEGAADEDGGNGGGWGDAPITSGWGEGSASHPTQNGVWDASAETTSQPVKAVGWSVSAETQPPVHVGEQEATLTQAPVQEVAQFTQSAPVEVAPSSWTEPRAALQPTPTWDSAVPYQTSGQTANNTWSATGPINAASQPATTGWGKPAPLKLSQVPLTGWEAHAPVQSTPQPVTMGRGPPAPVKNSQLAATGWEIPAPIKTATQPAAVGWGPPAPNKNSQPPTTVWNAPTPVQATPKPTPQPPVNAWDTSSWGHGQW